MRNHNRIRKNKWTGTVIGSLSAAVLFAAISAGGTAFADTTAAAKSPIAYSTAEYAQFLKQNDNVSFDDSITRGEFIQAVAQALHLEPSGNGGKPGDLSADSPYYEAALALLEKGILTQDKIRAEEPLTEADSVYIAVKAAELKELAYTYPKDKIKAALSQLQIDLDQLTGLTLQASQELAAAVDTGLLPSEAYATFQRDRAASAEFATLLLGQVVSAKGLYKNYIGSVSDSDIYRKVHQAWKTQDIIKADDLQKIVNEALKQNLVTGYNLKDARFNANFDSALSLTYGHSDITHALQLIGLLRGEGINAKVQLEPKTSAFIYLKEWGEPVQTDDYQVVQIENGNYIAYAKEYDIAFEFASAEQKVKFQDIVLKYAKKNSEDATGLIYGSWWQPLYYSLTEIKDYKEISNNYIAKGNYIAQSFSLSDKTADIAAGIKKIDKDAEVKSYRFWADEPFYNYLLGEYK